MAEANKPAAARTGARVALVAAVAQNGVIGRGTALPWYLPDDLKYFQRVTLHKPIVMGRRTFESIGRALPGRRNIVLSRADGAAAAGIEVVRSLEEAQQLAGDVAEICVIGGAQIYRLALPLAQRIYLTRVQAAVEGDVYFPLRDFSAWREVERVEHAADERHPYAMSFSTLEWAAGSGG